MPSGFAHNGYLELYCMYLKSQQESVTQPADGTQLTLDVTAASG